MEDRDTETLMCPITFQIGLFPQMIFCRTHTLAFWGDLEEVWEEDQENE